MKTIVGANPTLGTTYVGSRSPKEILEFLLDRENATWYGSAIELEHHVDGETLFQEAREAVHASK